MRRSILIVDDVLSNRLILNEMLHREYTVLEADSGEAALEILSRECDSISAVLLDISMPGIDGFEVLSRIRSNQRFSMMPVIMITGSEDKETRIKSLALGANDFVMKPYSLEILKHCLQNNIAFREAMATVSALQRDRLTGLYSRESFFDKVRELVAAHEPGYYVMTCFDIDQFKILNDQYGTLKGDEVLQHIAEVFSKGLAPLGGLCSRISADNFAAFYPQSYSDSEEIDAMREEATFVSGLATPIIFSVGRYVITDVAIQPSAMYDRAKLAAASVKGRYDVKVAQYDDAMRERLVREQEIIMEMEHALLDGQFEVWFQPQYNHSTDARIGAEALVRWRHPDKGLIPPGVFIPIFERNGFVYSLDKFVWNKVCQYLRKWIDGGRDPLPVSVNISRYDVLRPDLVEFLCGLIQNYNLPIDLLRLEITESAFAESAQRIVDVVKELLRRGFTVEIDDFGSGYSSLNTLKDVPVQILKLDMKFLESGDDSQRGGNIVESIVRMAKWLGMSVIAEGVETLTQANYLRTIGCNYIQGYLYAKPMPAGEYETRCMGGDREERLLTLETVENLDNNAFWNPDSIDTLIFNSYVGGACIYEYHAGTIELLRATDKYAQIIGSVGLTVEDALKINWAEHLDDDSRRRVIADIEESVRTKKEVTGEYRFLDLPNCPHETYLRSSMRVIATAGERCLVYCTNENMTAQRQAERRERLTAKQLSAIMENINGGVSADVLEGDALRRVFANDTFYKQIGYTREQYEQRFDKAASTVLPEDRAAVMAQTKRLTATGQSGTIEFRVRCRDGSVRWQRCDTSVIDYPGEEKPVLLSVTLDITEQRETERKAQLLSEQLQAVMNNVDLGILAAVVKSGTVRMLFANNRYYEILSYTKEQFDAEIETAYQTVAVEDRQRMIDETAAISESGESALLVYKALTRDGRERIFRAAISMGRLTGVDDPVQFTILRDITEETEVELRERFIAEQIKSMMSDMPGGFVRMRANDDGVIRPVYINEGFLTLTGMSKKQAAELYENDALEGVHPDDLSIVKDAIQRMLVYGESSSARYRLRYGKEGYIWLSVFGRVTKDELGDTYLNVYFSDASEQVKQEETQRELLDNIPSGAGMYQLKDGQMSLTYQNNSFYELVGLPGCDNNDHGPMSAVHPDDVPIIMRDLMLAIEQGRDVSCDIRMRHLTQGYRPVHLLGRIVPQAQGEFTIYTTFTPTDDGGKSYQRMLPAVLSAIMQSTTDLSFAKDLSFRYLTCSSAFARMAGLQSEREVIGRTDYELFPVDMADKFRRDDETLIASGRAMVDITESIPSPDGSPRCSSTSKYLLRDGAGEVIGLYGVGRDITKVVAQQTQLQPINDSVPGGIATYTFKDDRLRIAYCNDGFLKLFGGTHEGYEARGELDPIDWVLEDDRPELIARIHALVDNNLPMDVVFRINVIGGGFKWINEKAIAYERKGDTVLFNALLLDVTERQTVNELLRISEEENHLAIQQGGSIVSRFDVAERTLTLSPDVAAAYAIDQAITGVPDEPVRLGLISPESAEAYTAFFTAIINGGETGTVLYQQRYFGAWRWIEAKSTTIFSDEGIPVKAVISMQDVTDRLEKETIYLKWQHSLEDRQPDSYTLFRCNLNRNTSYDTREGTLFTFDLGSDDASFNERAKAYADKCVHEDDHDKYLAFANSDAMLAGYYRGRRSDVLEYRELSENGTGCYWRRLTVDLVESPNSSDVEAYMLYEDINEAKKAELQTKELSETDPLTGIMNRAAFTAKVDKALRAAKPDSRHAFMMLDIDGFKQVNDVFGHGAGDQALIELAQGLRSIVRRDDCVARLGGDEFVVFLSGISDESAAFNKAREIGALARRSYSLEVSISVSIGIAFAPRDGATFDELYKKADSALYYVKGSGKDSFAEYRADMSDEHLKPEPDSFDVKGVKLADKKRRMLIVEDNKIDHVILQKMFKDEFIIEKARDGQSALIRLRHYGSAISVVLLDLMMPGMDGFTVLAQMHESPELRGIPVIIVSGDESREACLNAIRMGATDFVLKPVDQELLRLRVHSAISRAENERLRAKNSMLEVMNDERVRYEAALEDTGVTFVEFSWLTGSFTYYPSVSKYLLGNYDERPLWQILLADGAADADTVRELQRMVHSLAENTAQTCASLVVTLKTPSNTPHRFRITARKLVSEQRSTRRVIIAIDDLEYEVHE